MKMSMISAVIWTVLTIALYGSSELGFCREENLIRMKLGGIHNGKGFKNSAEIDSLALFAVQEHNKNENTLLEFARVLKTEEQVVAGKIYYLTLEAIDSGKKKVYEAKVYVKPWMKFKQLQEFRHVEDQPSSFTLLNIVKQDGHDLGWKVLPTSNPEVQAAANHAIKSMERRSNSLSPYVLLEILRAKSKVVNDLAKYELLLKLKQGMKEDNFKVEVVKKRGGNFYLNY